MPHDGRYLTDVFNDEAISFIRAHAAKPFAMWLAHHAPHAVLGEFDLRLALTDESGKVRVIQKAHFIGPGAPPR